MFGRETRMLLRHYLEHGKSKSKSALPRELGVSRDTIHRWIRAGDLDEISVAYGPRRPVATKLDPFRPILETRLAAADPGRRYEPARCGEPSLAQARHAERTWFFGTTTSASPRQ